MPIFRPFSYGELEGSVVELSWWKSSNPLAWSWTPISWQGKATRWALLLLGSLVQKMLSKCLSQIRWFGLEAVWFGWTALENLVRLEGSFRKKEIRNCWEEVTVRYLRKDPAVSVLDLSRKLWLGERQESFGRAWHDMCFGFLTLRFWPWIGCLGVWLDIAKLGWIFRGFRRKLGLLGCLSQWLRWGKSIAWCYSRTWLLWTGFWRIGLLSLRRSLDIFSWDSSYLMSSSMT